MSKALRHRTTKTTELYYAKLRADDAFRDLEAAFADHDDIGKGPVPKHVD